MEDVEDFLRDSCDNFPWKSKEEDQESVSPKFRRILRPYLVKISPEGLATSNEFDCNGKIARNEALGVEKGCVFLLKIQAFLLTLRLCCLRWGNRK